MKQNLNEVIEKINQFLELPTLTNKQKDQIKSHLHIDNFKTNKAVNKTTEIVDKIATSPFIRKGIIGDHQNYFDEIMEKDWDEWLSKEFSGTGIKMNCAH